MPHSRAHLASGDIIPITLKNGENIELIVAHDERGEQFLTFRDCMIEEMPMNENDTNSGGWRDCKMRSYAREVFDLLPDDLKAVIIPTKIVQCINGERIECEDKLFCLSYTQMFGSHRCVADMEPEDSQLDIYKIRKNRVKRYGGDNGGCWYWLRSPYAGDTTLFYFVYSDGSSCYDSAGYPYGVCFGFRIQSNNQYTDDEAATLSCRTSDFRDWLGFQQPCHPKEVK